jgi:beta-phosphoglucomutase-like phosphatase (HAD superfamily)
MPTAGVEGVLLDVDGTLVLSNDAHAQAWSEAFKDVGMHVPPERARPLIGMGGDKLMPALVPNLSPDEGIGKVIAERRKQRFLERYALTLEPAPGGRSLVERLRAEGKQISIASSAKRDELETLLRAAQVDDLLPASHATTADNAQESKPAPDVIAVAVKRLGLPPERVMLIGDTPYDVESAGRARLGTTAVRCGGFSDTELNGARALYNDPADLLARYDESLLAGNESQ